MLGLPTAMFSRGNNWIQAGCPSTWTARVSMQEEREVLHAMEQGAAMPLVMEAMPAALRAYACRPEEGHDSLPAEGRAARAVVPWEGLTFFDFVAGVYKRGAGTSSPAIVGFKTIHPDQDPEGYFYTKLLMHSP